MRLTDRHVEILAQIVEIAKPDDYLFENTLGDPIDQRSFYKLFCTAQQSLGIKHRDLYATKDTYVSIALTKGVNLTWLSEQTGVAEGTLRTHYGRFIHASKSDALELSKIDSGERDRRGLPLACPLATVPSEKSLAISGEKWWSRRDLNPRPLRCERSALPAELLPHPWRDANIIA